MQHSRRPWVFTRPCLFVSQIQRFCLLLRFYQFFLQRTQRLLRIGDHVEEQQVFFCDVFHKLIPFKSTKY